MPFSQHADAFAPEILEVMEAAFHTAVKSSAHPLNAAQKAEIANSIVKHAGEGVTDIGELTKAAMCALASSSA
jgi:hypothetical protein